MTMSARGLLARAAFRRAVGDWDGAARDLDEAQEIAEPGPMRLYLCDIALERARLALARREAFAPLNGLVEPSPPPPALPDAAEAAALREEARKELDIARKLIAECGYHRRDEELSRARRRRRRPPPLRRSAAARVSARRCALSSWPALCGPSTPRHFVWKRRRLRPCIADMGSATER